jgi:hypothetical protein
LIIISIGEEKKFLVKIEMSNIKVNIELSKEFYLNVIYLVRRFGEKNSSSVITSLIIDGFEIFIAYCTSYRFYRPMNNTIEQVRKE